MLIYKHSLCPKFQKERGLLFGEFQAPLSAQVALSLACVKLEKCLSMAGVGSENELFKKFIV